MRAPLALFLLGALAGTAPPPADATRAAIEALSRQRVELGRRIAAGETALAVNAAQRARLQALRDRDRQWLAREQQSLAALIAAMQSSARAPLIAALAAPDAAIRAGRAGAVLDAVRPAIAERTRAAQLRLERAAIAEARLVDRQRQLEQLLAALTRNRSALDTATARQTALLATTEGAAERTARAVAERAARARSLGGLVRELDRDDAVAAGSGQTQQLALLWPASGRVAARFGSINEVGVSEKGLSLQAAADTQVVSPAAGKVVFAGPFRTYGSMVIIEHDGGLVSLLAGLGRIDVAPGRALLAGEPVGRMAPEGGRLYLELRREGAPVDPLPFIQRSSTK